MKGPQAGKLIAKILKENGAGMFYANLRNEFQKQTGLAFLPATDAFRKGVAYAREKKWITYKAVIGQVSYYGLSESYEEAS